MKRRIYRINWVSEVQNDAARRALLVATFPYFLAFNVLAVVVNYSLHIALVALVTTLGSPFALWRSVHLLTKSCALRWSNPKPRGENDWVTEAIDKQFGGDA